MPLPLASLAQLAERNVSNFEVIGSTPIGRSIFPLRVNNFRPKVMQTYGSLRHGKELDCGSH